MNPLNDPTASEAGRRYERRANLSRALLILGAFCLMAPALSNAVRWSVFGVLLAGAIAFRWSAWRLRRRIAPTV